MKPRDLPPRWKAKIAEYLCGRGITDRQELNAFDFALDKVAKIRFEDDSYAEFRYPLVIPAPEWGEIGVFTEHCGYHLFGMAGTEIDIVDRE